MSFGFNDYLIPLETGNAVSVGWGDFQNAQGVTWHWTATWDLATCRKILGGENPMRKGEASAHYGVGTTREEGIDRYVTLDNRSWHAGAGQTLTWEGKRSTRDTSGVRTCVGIETVHIGYARSGVPSRSYWTTWATPNNLQELSIPPWPAEQIEMMIELGKYIRQEVPTITAEDHHGHCDLCPGRKMDPIGFPWVEVLDGIYGKGTVEDVWTPYQTIKQRQSALIKLGYDLGSYGADGHWGRLSSTALEKFQRDQGLEEDGYWTVFVAREIHREIMRPLQSNETGFGG